MAAPPLVGIVVKSSHYAPREAAADLRRSFSAVLHDAEVLRFAAEALVRSIGDACIIRLISPRGDLLVPVVIADRDPAELERIKASVFGQAILLGGSVYARALREHRTLVLRSDDPVLLRDHPVKAAAMRGIGIQRLAVAPVLYFGEFIGTIAVGSRDPDGVFSAENVAFLDDASRLVASALARARGH